MRYRSLGPEISDASIIGLGALHFGVFLDEKESANLIHGAMDRGVNFIDTAPLYGSQRSESIVGQAVKDRRDKVLISTKAGLEPLTRDDGSFGVDIARQTAAYIRKSVETSLRKLDTDYIDFFQFHAFDAITPFDETFGALDRLVEEGKILSIGCSNFSPEEVEQAFAGTSGFSHSMRGLQCHYNMIERRAEYELLPVCEKHDLSLICNRGLARGVLTGKYRKGEPLPEGSRASVSWRVEKGLTGPVLDFIEELAPLAEELGISISELSLAWLLDRPRVAMTLVGCRNFEQLEMCIKAAEVCLEQGITDQIDEMLVRAGLHEEARNTPSEFLEK